MKERQNVVARGNLPLSSIVVREVSIFRHKVKTSFVPPELSI